MIRVNNQNKILFFQKCIINGNLFINIELFIQSKAFNLFVWNVLSMEINTFY